jgi:hypothetical protein
MPYEILLYVGIGVGVVAVRNAPHANPSNPRSPAIFPT